MQWLQNHTLLWSDLSERPLAHSQRVLRWTLAQAGHGTSRQGQRISSRTQLHKHDNKIPDDQRQQYIAQGAYFLARATLRFAQTGGIPPEEKQKAGQEAIELARRALEIHTQLFGTENERVANDMNVIAETLDYFNRHDDDEEVIRLFEQSKAFYVRVHGSSTVNVAVSDGKLGEAYHNRAVRARAAKDLDRELTNLELALPYFREAARIFYRAIGRVADANNGARNIAAVEEMLRQLAIVRAAATATATKG